ncbi:MAG: DUF444 family protein [Candidatus Sericytochromatia bacterium]|nr:DUF444 family protein [Candidatus Sericytochromatia bacterium]
MANKIEKDIHRFQRIVQGKVRENLRKYLSKGEMIGKKGDHLVSIPIPQIEIPHFRLGPRQNGVGQGAGENGDPIGQGPGQGGAGAAGDSPGQHVLEVELTLDELAKILGEELELPNIKPKGTKTIVSRHDKYDGVAPVGPESLRHFKRTYKEALKRQIASGTYDPANPRVVPIKRDTRYRTWSEVQEPESNAVIIYMMDISGSMEDEQKEIVRIETFWIDTWLRSQYKGVVTRYIVHDTAAKEVDQNTFYRIKEAGGTMISSAYKLCAAMMDADYPTAEWNIYPFHFSDGDNWSQRDTEECMHVLRNRVLPGVNQFGYGQVESPYGTGKFIKELGQLSTFDNLVLSEIKDREHILPSIKTFLGKGR